jgi:predicted negative regulator of RcsB-dependent stress response
MAQPTRRQIEQDLSAPDPFFDAMRDARDYFEDNRTTVLAGVLGVATLFFAIVAGVSWYSSQASKAATDFASAVSSLEFDSPSAAEASLKSLSGRSNAGPYKSLAALYRGDLATEAGRFDEAVAEYDTFLADASTDYLKQIGLMGKAAALEKAGKAPEAGTILDQAATIDGPYRTAALSDRARLAEKAGDKATATTNLQKLLEIEGSGPGAAAIEQRLQALK